MLPRLMLVTALAVSTALTQPAEATDTAPAQRGGTMIMGMTNDPPTVNPAITTGAPDKLIGCMIYEGLVRVVEGFHIEPALAKSWEISSDGLNYTFHLADAKWQDGNAFTSSDVQYSLQNINAKYGPLFAASGHAITAIDTPDPTTAVIRLSRPFGPFLLSLSCDQNGAILPAACVRQHRYPAQSGDVGAADGNRPLPARRLGAWRSHDIGAQSDILEGGASVSR